MNLSIEEKDNNEINSEGEITIPEDILENECGKESKSESEIICLNIKNKKRRIKP